MWTPRIGAIKNDFLSFAADKRNLTAVPKYPNTPHNVNGKDIKTVWDAENFLYLINSEKFSTKRQFIDALKNTDYAMDLFHFEKAYAESEVRELKTKRNGGKRLVIYYMSIGGRRITGIIGMAPGKQASPAG